MAVVRKLEVVVDEITSYSEDIKHFVLLPKKGLPRFKAGQFLHLAIDPYDPSFNWPESRVFSIANAPTRRDAIEILVSKKGSFTTKLFEKTRIGDTLWIKLPYGTFNFDESIENDTVLIAGGTGISPFISFIQFAIDTQLNPAINLYYGVRSNDFVIYEKLFKEADETLARFNYIVFLEQFQNESLNNSRKGLLDVKAIVKESLVLNNPYYYLSGPPQMILAFEKELNQNRIDPNRIKFDNWE